MRVITGQARGTKLAAPEGTELRPTADRVKEALFSSIQFEIEGRRVADIFAGSGQLGIEALSRGAREAFFIDSGAQAIACIKKNLEHTRFDKQATVLEGDYTSGIRRLKPGLDMVFIDPPYGQGLAEKALVLVAPLTAPTGVIICETAARDPMPEQAGVFRLAVRREYGKTTLHFYRAEEPDTE